MEYHQAEDDFAASANCARVSVEAWPDESGRCFMVGCLERTRLCHFACIGVPKARVLANEELQPFWGRGVPIAKHVGDARDLYRIYWSVFIDVTARISWG